MDRSVLFICCEVSYFFLLGKRHPSLILSLFMGLWHLVESSADSFFCMILCFHKWFFFCLGGRVWVYGVVVWDTKGGLWVGDMCVQDEAWALWRIAAMMLCCVLVVGG